ncbi:MAG: VCBS repeat-containing protein [Candidatus Sulfotelmatobacter sp.]
MTRLSATATIAALLLLAIAQGFGATSSTKSTVKSSPKSKIASKSTAKPYHITAQNQFHIKSTKHPSSALARLQAKEMAHAQISKKVHLPNAKQHVVPGHAALEAVRRIPGKRPMLARRHQTNPPTGKIGFVSATQIAEGGESWGQVQAATLGGLTAFITVVETASGCAYSEVAANGDGTFTAPAATLTPTASGSCDANFVVGDLDGDGNTDIVEAYGSGTAVALLSNADGTFTEGTPFVITAAGLTGGTLMTDATSGFLDLVVLDDTEPSNLITVPGNGDGTFNIGLATTVPLVPAAADGVGYNVILADFDGDGLLDVAENDDGTGQLNVYLAAATYAGVAIPTPDGVYDACSSTAGSLTGSLAIVETDCGDNQITVYNNDGTGTFSEGVYYPVAVTPSTTADTYPEASTIADVNGDGNGDVVVVNDDSSDVTILTGNGDGTLNLTSVGYATGGFPYQSAIVADLNGDGLMDILVSDDNQSLVWMAGYGDGTFQAAKDFYAPVPDNNYGYSYSSATGDLNGDGFPDVVLANYGDDTMGITVFLSNPDGSLQPGVNYGTSGEFGYVTVADFNGDGKLDIAASNFDGYVQIFTGTGTGNFISGPYYSTTPEGTAIVAGALNTSGAAGFNDLAVTNYEGSVNVLVNDGAGGFMSAVAYPLTNGACNLATGDIDGDGNLDLAIAECEGSQIGVLMGVGDGTFGAVSEPDVPVGGYPFGVALADLDGDGNLDIATTSGSQNVAVVLGAGDGTFPAAGLLTMPSSLVLYSTNPFYNPYPSAIQVTDVDGDGIPDLVYDNADYSTVGVMFGTGTGSLSTPAPYFFDPVEFPAGQYAYGMNIADLNGDGSPDAVASSDDFAGATVLINANGAGAAPNYSLSSNTSFINIADGGTGTATITLTPVNFYSGTVTFSCGGLPLDVTCAFAPATLTPLGNAPVSTTLTVTTAAPHGALHMPADANPHQGRTSLLACLTGMGLFGLLLSGDWKNKRNRRVGILLGVLVLGMMFSLVGCSSSTTPGTPVGAQTIQVTGTGSDGTTQAVNITINVF